MNTDHLTLPRRSLRNAAVVRADVIHQRMVVTIQQQVGQGQLVELQPFLLRVLLQKEVLE